jgi:hypothetical protein
MSRATDGFSASTTDFNFFTLISIASIIASSGFAGFSQGSESICRIADSIF